MTWPYGFRNYFIIASSALLLTLVVVSLVVGRGNPSSLDPLTVLSTVLGNNSQEYSSFQELVVNVRVPRTIAAVIVGAGLAMSGAAVQGAYRNPLVSPYILGITSGAGCAAACALLFTSSLPAIELAAFAGGLVTAMITYGLNRFTQVLAGIAVGMFFGSLTALMKFLADPVDRLPAIVFWLMGSFSRVSIADAIPLCTVIVLGIILLFLYRWQVNILSMGEESAESLGVKPRRARVVILAATALIAAGTVALCGVIGWVGLVIPHICRFFCGPDNRLLIPVCAVAGGAYLLAMDILIRTVLPGEMPIGILTALVGAPLFALLLRNGRNGWEGKT